MLKSVLPGRNTVVQLGKVPFGEYILLVIRETEQKTVGCGSQELQGSSVPSLHLLLLIVGSRLA